MYQPVQIPQAPPPTPFQRNPLIEALLAKAMQPQQQSFNPIEGLLKGVLAGGGGGRMPFDPASMIDARSRMMNDARNSQIEGMLRGAQAQSELAQARNYNAQAATEEQGMPYAVQKLMEEVNSVKAQTGQRQASEDAMRALAGQRTALTDPKVQNEQMKVLLTQEKLATQQEITERWNELTPLEQQIRLGRIGQLDAQIRALDSLSGMRDARTAETNLLAPLKADAIVSGTEENEAQRDKYRAQIPGVDADSQVKQQTMMSRIQQSNNNAASSGARRSIAENKAATQEETVALELIDKELMPLQRFRTQYGDAEMKAARPQDYERLRVLESLRAHYGPAKLKGTKNYQPGANPTMNAIEQDRAGTAIAPPATSRDPGVWAEAQRRAGNGKTAEQIYDELLRLMEE